jgi:lysophospholipase L1-like esterase
MSERWSDATVVFVGDSVTAAGRRSRLPWRRRDLGNGWVRDIARRVAGERPDLGLRVVNRGVNGDRTRELALRWQRDVLDERPDVVSVLVGVNDTWRGFDAADPTPVEQYEDCYRALLERTVATLPEVRLVLGEPFLLFEPPGLAGMRADLDARIAVVHRLAVEHGAVLVPFDRVLVDAGASSSPAAIADDGIHPTPAGHRLMADTWLSALGLATD